MSQKQRSRFVFRRRLLEVLLLLWVANYLHEQYQIRQGGTASSTPVQQSTPARP